MNLSTEKRKARTALPVIRFMQANLPLPHWLLKQRLARVKMG